MPDPFVTKVIEAVDLIQVFNIYIYIYIYIYYFDCSVVSSAMSNLAVSSLTLHLRFCSNNTGKSILRNQND